MKNSTTNNLGKSVRPAKINALFNLLEDRDPTIFMPAMSEIIQLQNTNIHQALAEHQESDDPQLRSRVHQIESIFTTNGQLQSFISSVKQNRCDAWKGILFIESIFNPQFQPRLLLRKITELCEQVLTAELTLHDLAEVLHRLNFTIPKEELLTPRSFSLHNTVHFRTGHNIILTIFARQFARRFGLDLLITLHKGRHCLVDKNKNLIDPSQNWAIENLNKKEKIYPCTEKEVVMTFCNALYLSFLAEGQLRPIHKMSSIISQLTGTDKNTLPFPLGNKNDH